VVYLYAVFPESETVQNFENPIIYTVTAEDGSTQNYQVEVIVTPPEKNNFLAFWIVAIIITAVIGGISTIIFIKLKNKKIHAN